MRFNPWALGFAFGFARVVFYLFSFGGGAAWLLRLSAIGLTNRSPVSGLFIILALLWEFLGGLFAGAVFGAVYNAIANRRDVEPATPAI
jgi:formate/nitrite transporter FocA (FNT family)